MASISYYFSLHWPIWDMVDMAFADMGTHVVINGDFCATILGHRLPLH
jgi:hypothetical protein